MSPEAQPPAGCRAWAPPPPDDGSTMDAAKAATGGFAHEVEYRARLILARSSVNNPDRLVEELT